MMKMKRIISLLLALVLIVGMVPPMAVRADETEPAAETEAAVVAEIAETTEVTEPAETTAATSITEVTEPVETTEVTETTEPVETTEAAETTEPVETTEVTEPVETTEAAETTEPVETTEVTEPVETTEATETTEPVETTETTDPTVPDETVAETKSENADIFKDLTDTDRITQWVQRDYGFDLIETDYAEYQKLRFAEIAQSSEIVPFASASLPTPQDVTWSRETYGMLTMSFLQDFNLSQVVIDVTIYRNGEFYEGGAWWFEGTYEKNTPLTLDFVPRILDSGMYYATVQVVSRTGSAQGWAANSDTWNFTLPSSRLSTPGGLRWEGDIAAWNAVSNARGYYVHWNSQYGNVTGTWMYDISGYELPTSFGVPTENSGLTKFTVQALADLKYYQHSYESGWSDSHLSSGNVIRTKSSKFTYQSAFASKNADNVKVATADYTYDESWFDTPSTNGYNHDLATMSLSMAMAAFGVGGSNRGRNIKNLFDQLGFTYTDSSIHYPKPSRDSIGYAIGSKMVSNTNGTYMLVAVAVRGKGYGAEWASNAKVGTASDHQGFDEAAGEVTEALQKYLKDNNQGYPVKVWITGYSRAAATTNIAAQRINAGIKLGYYPGLQADGLYAYCFECPRTVQTNSPAYSVEYKNIYNIVNHADFVTKVAMEDWGFNRYGTTYYLPSPELSSKYSSEKKALEKAYKNLLSGVVSNTSDTVKEAIEQMDDQGEFTDKVADALASFFSDPVVYTVGYQSTIQDLIVEIMVDDDIKAGTAFDLFFEGIPAFLVLHPFISTRLGLNYQKIGYAHYPELCLSWMKALDGDSVTFSNPKTRRLVLNCPIDISVYDSTGALVAMIVDNEPQEIEGSYIGAYLDENGQKVIILPTDEEYTVKVNATDDGTMSYQIQDVDVDQNEVTHLVSFHDVEIQKGDSLTAAVQNTAVESAAYTLADATGAVIEADLELTGNIPEYEVTVDQEGEGTVIGGGKFIIGEYSQLTAEDGDRSVFRGWYENGELISEENTIRFRVENNRNLTAVFLSTDVTMELDREYMALEYDSNAVATEKLELIVTPEQWTEFITWSADGDAISVDQEGTITAQKAGAAYAVATASFKGHTFSARCRVDVAGSDIAEDLQEHFGVNGVQLGTTAVTTELFSANYAEITIAPLLSQNLMNFSSIDQPKPQDNGVAVTDAWFTDEAVRELFDLIVKDDRTLLVVPTDEAKDAAVKGSFPSTVTVVVDGSEFVTAAALKLTVKNTLPKLKATNVSLNSFYSCYSADVLISGGQVTQLWAADPDAFPDWLELSENTLSLKNNAPEKGSVKLSLMADVEGYTVGVPVTVTVKVSRTAPQFKLSATTVTLQDDYANSSGVVLRLQPKSSKQGLSGMHVESITAPDGYRIDQFESDGGSFTLVPERKPEPKDIYLKVNVAGAKAPVELKLKVKVSPVKVKLSKSTITLGWAAPYSEIVALTLTPADYVLTDPGIRITDKSGKIEFVRDSFPEFDVEFRNGQLYVSSKDTTSSYKGDTYKVWVSAFEDGQETALTVKIPGYTQTAIQSTLKAEGVIDLSYPNSTIKITPSYKNYALVGNEEFGYSITAKGAKGTPPDATDLFDVSISTTGIVTISAKDPSALSTKTKYEFALVTMAENLAQTRSKPVKLTVKQTAVKLKLDSSKISLNKDLGDVAQIGVSCTTAGYAFDLEKAVLSYDEEKLDIQRLEGKLVIGLKSGAEYGKTYPVEVRAYAGAPVAKLNVAVLKNTAMVQSTIKATGMLDVIREGTAITVKPTYTNVLNVDVDHVAKLKIYSSENNYESPVKEVTAEAGVFTIDSSIISDSNYKYKAQLETNLYGPEKPVKSKMISLNVKMGTAKLTVKTADTILFAKDKYDRAQIWFEAKDATLNKVASIAFKNAKQAEQFEIMKYGDGHYAIGFKSNNVDQSLIGKTVTVTLNVFMEGNYTAKANTTANIKLTIVK